MFFNDETFVLKGKKYYEDLGIKDLGEKIKFYKELKIDENNLEDIEFFNTFKFNTSNYNNTVSRIDQEGNCKIILLKPGLKKEFLKITLEGENLNINYTISKENKLQDFECDSFEQKWVLTNENVKKENIKVIYKGGILIVSIEKSSPSQKHQIFEIPVE